MEDKKKASIKAYLENRLVEGPKTLNAMTLKTGSNTKLPTRSALLVINRYLNDFNSKTSETRWVLMPGLRGTGKTTIVAQLFSKLECSDNCKIYISIDDAKRVLNTTISEILEVYEDFILKKKFESLEKPVYLFLDEVQYDDTWGITLKNIYDRSKNVFIICTGSSALSLQTNPDVARRVAIVKIYPLSYPEYRMISATHYPITKLGANIKDALYGSRSAEEVYNKLRLYESLVLTYFKKVQKTSPSVKDDISTYLKYGTLPSALAIKSEPLIFSQINQTMNTVLTRDVPQIGLFDKSTIEKLSQMLYIISGTDVASFKSIAQTIESNEKTVASVFDALEKTELLLRVYPYGAKETQVRKPSKFLFSSPAYRASYYNLVGSITSFENYKGKLLEDMTGFYLTRTLSKSPGYSITYDTAEKGADFIVDTGIPDMGKLVIEVGFGKNTIVQVMNTMKKVSNSFGLCITNTGKLKLHKDENILVLPIHFFLLT